MTERPAHADDSPVVVGGLGGSGTRVFAKIMRECGYHIGGNLNGALDYLTFTVLANRPGLTRPSPDDLRRVGHLLRREGIGLADVAALGRAALRPGPWAGRRMRLRMAQGALRDRGPEIRGAWGFKNPATARVLPEISEAFPQVRYVHVVRHGLDMSLSRNVVQLEAWGPSLGVHWSGHESDKVAAHLEFWARATAETHEAGERLLGDRYLMVRYDDLLYDSATLARLIEFLGSRMSTSELAARVEIKGSSTGRWRSHAELFGEGDRERVARWGFDVEA